MLIYHFSYVILYMVHIDINSVNVLFNQKIRIENLFNNAYNIAWNANGFFL